MNIYQSTLSDKARNDNRKFYMAALKHLFTKRGRYMSKPSLLRRTVNGQLHDLSKTVYLLGEKGIEPAYYNFNLSKWVRMPSKEGTPLLTNTYIDPDWGLDKMIREAVFDYLVGDIKVTEVIIKSSHLYKDNV